MVDEDRLRSLELLDELGGGFAALGRVRLLGDREAVDESLGEPHADLLDEVEQRLLNHLVLDVDAGKELGDDIDPDLQVDLLEALPQLLLDLRQIAVLEPDLQETQRRLQRLGLQGV